MFKLLMSWDIRPGYEEEYFEFVVREFGPGLAECGIRLTDAWFTTYGDRPQILAGGVAENLEDLQRTLTSEAWRRLKEELLTYVTGYSEKIIRASGEFQL